MLRDNAATSHPPGDDRTMATGTALPGVVPTSSPGSTPPSAPELCASRASTRNNPNDEDEVEGVLNEGQLRQLKSLPLAVGQQQILLMVKKNPPPSQLSPTQQASLTTQGSRGEKQTQKSGFPPATRTPSVPRSVRTGRRRLKRRWLA